MRKVPVAIMSLAIAAFATSVHAQRNALEDAFDSPIKMEPEPYAVGSVVACSLALPSSAALFGTDQHDGVFITNEMFSPFRVFAYDEDCQPLSTWSSSGVATATTTGIGFSGSGSTYWLCEPFGTAALLELTTGTGLPTGVSVPVPSGGSVWGALVVDDNQPDEILCITEIALDLTFCLDMHADGAVICSFANQDNRGNGAFGNGISDAVFPSDCSGQTLVNPSGPIFEGTVVRAGQYDCTGNDPECTDRWDLLSFSFVNGICEFRPTTSGRNLMIAENVTSTVVRLGRPCDISACQAVDPDMDLLWANGSLGGTDFRVPVLADASLAFHVDRTPAGNGRFVHHMNAGVPSTATIAPLADLGTSCFPFLSGSPVVVDSNIGRTHLVGASSYFGMPIDDPAKAPISLASLMQPVIDMSNLPLGSLFTHQLLVVNPASSSRRGASFSNALILEITF